MATKTYRLLYDNEFVPQLRHIERKYHSVIRDAIENNLIYEPDRQNRNRKLLIRPTDWGARWELRCGQNNEFRVFYSVYPEQNEVHILAVGQKVRDRLYLYGKEIAL